MAAIMPNIPGTGNNIRISNYVAGITESYPNVNRQRKVESSINSKETIDFLPTNIGVNQSISDEYLEYRINGTVGSFFRFIEYYYGITAKATECCRWK